MSTKQNNNGTRPLAYLCISILFLVIPFIVNQLSPPPCTGYLCFDRLPFYLFQLFLPLVSISLSIVFMIKLIIALIKKSNKFANKKQTRKGTIFLSIAETVLGVLAVSWIVAVIIAKMISNNTSSEIWLETLAFVTPYVIFIAIIFATIHVIVITANKPTPDKKQKETSIYLSIAKKALIILAIVWLLSFGAGVLAPSSVGGFYVLIPVITTPIIIAAVIVLAIIDGINNKS